VVDDAVHHGIVGEEGNNAHPSAACRTPERVDFINLKESLLSTVGTTDAGKPTARVAAVQIALHNLLDDRPEEAILLLETALILRQESVEVMKYHPVECSPFRMSRAIDS